MNQTPIQYGRLWPFPRYNAYINYKMPEHILEGASDHLLQVLGDHRFHPEEHYQ